jgi:hypothetical protein
MQLLVTSDTRDAGDLAALERWCIERGIPYQVRGIPTHAFGTVAWDFELHADICDDDGPKAA